VPVAGWQPRRTDAPRVSRRAARRPCERWKPRGSCAKTAGAYAGAFQALKGCNGAVHVAKLHVAVQAYQANRKANFSLTTRAWLDYEPN
jgi:hypothetical protein